jgi:hypothetical protein
MYTVETIFLSDIRKHPISEQTSLVKEETFAVTHKGEFLGIVHKKDHFLGMPITKPRKGDVLYTAKVEHPDGYADEYEETTFYDIVKRLLESFYCECEDDRVDLVQT